MKTTDKLVAIGLGSFLLGVFPFLFAAAHVYPLGFHEWDWLASYAKEVGSTDYWEIQSYFYQNIGGRFVSTGLLGSLPFWYDLTTFRLVVISGITLFFLGVFFFFGQLKMGGFGKLLASICCLLFLHQLTNCYDSLLRFTCLPIYHLGQLGLFLCLILLYQLYQHRFQQWSYLLLLGVVSLLTSGTNEIALTQLFVCFCLVFMFSYKEPLAWRLFIPFLFLLVGAYWAIAAPGNFVRMEAYPSDQPLLRAFGLTIGVSAFLLIDWLLDSLLIPGLIIAAFLYLRYFSHSQLPILARPIYWLIALLICCPVSLFPLLYASGGTSLPEHIIDLLYLNNCMLAIGFILSLLSEYVVKTGGGTSFHPIVNIGVLLITVFMFGQMFFGGLSINRTNRNIDHPLSFVQVEANIGHAYLQLLTGVPQQYSLEMKAIEEQVKSCKTATCLVSPLSTSSFLGYNPLYDRMNGEGEAGLPAYLNVAADKVLYRTD